MQNEASETNAALEFAVNTLEVCHLALESLSTSVFMYNLTVLCLKSESISKFGVMELATLKIDQNVYGWLQVKNILVIGHSSCAGIETLMRMQDDGDSRFLNNWSFLTFVHMVFSGHQFSLNAAIFFFCDSAFSSLTHSWVINAKVAKLRTKAVAPHLSFDQQCRHCEKVLLESFPLDTLLRLIYLWLISKRKVLNVS